MPTPTDKPTATAPSGQVIKTQKDLDELMERTQQLLEEDHRRSATAEWKRFIQSNPPPIADIFRKTEILQRSRKPSRRTISGRLRFMVHC